jgi:pimeloyl-ACP methyl ester carboxylesterase
MVTFAGTALTPLLSFADVTLPNGIRLRYARQGRQSGPAMILLHGYCRVMPLLPPDLRVIAPDQRGHGDSARPASGYRIEDFADDVLQMMDALDIPSAVIVGHSMGSFVAQALVEHAPDRFTGVVLVSGAPRCDNDVVTGLGEAINALTDPVDEQFVREFQYSTVALPVPPEFMDAAIANSRRIPARVWKDILVGLLAYRPAAERPAVRTLVLGGKKDAVFSVAEQTQLARQFPDGRLQLFDAVGHALHWERPQAFVDALLRFAPVN